MRFHSLACLGLLLLTVAPASAQLTVLDQAQDQIEGEETAPVEPGGESEQASPCGTQPLTIARMNWPSAALLAEIHAGLVRERLSCPTDIIPGDLAATASSMGSRGQPAIAPEMWVTRIADVWNGAVDAQMVRTAAPTFAETTLEGWFIPAYMVNQFEEQASAAGLAPYLTAQDPATQVDATPMRFISCPLDWACAVINKNLITAHGLTGLVEVIEPANRFEMDELIAEAVSRRENFVFYYWQPNAVLAQLDFRALDMGEYSEEAMACLAALDCADPQPSAFPSELVVAAIAEWVFTEAPTIAAYFQRASMPLNEMNALLAKINEPGATVEGVAAQFVAERRDLWGKWIAGP